MFLHVLKINIFAFIIVSFISNSLCFGQSRKASANISVVNSIENDVVTIEFDKESAFIPNAELEKINLFLKLTSAMSPIDRYLVVAWSDKEYPKFETLASEDDQLAKERAAAVKQALNTGGANIIDTFEMTNRPNWIQKTLGTKTAKLKGEGLIFTNNARLFEDMHRQLIQEGGPKKVVIIAKFKREFVEDQ